MTEPTRNMLLCFGVCLIGIVIFVFALSYYEEPVQPIPSQREIQQRLTGLGKPRYNLGKIDGVIGKDSRTAWDNYTCDQYAKRAIEGE